METNVYEAGTGAVRSNDLAAERWDLLSGAACRHLYQASDPRDYGSNPLELVGEAIHHAQAFLGFDTSFGDDRLAILTRGWWKLAAAIQVIDAPPEELSALEGYGHGRHYPYHALRRTSRTCHEGATKYAEENWLRGFQVKGLANHLIPHMVSWLCGRAPLSAFWKYDDGKPRIEDELGHAMWGFMAITHMWLFRRDEMARLLLGPDYSITESLAKYHKEHTSRRDAQKPKPGPSETPAETLIRALRSSRVSSPEMMSNLGMNNENRDPRTMEQGR